MPDTTDVLHGALAGLAGAVSVNILHEITRKTTTVAPRMDIVGMRGLAAVFDAAGSEPPEHLRTATFAADVAANSIFYSAVALAGPERAIAAGAALGALMGIGGVLLPPPMHLGDKEVNRTPETQAIVVALYLAGGLVAGAAYQALAQRSVR